MRGPLVAALAMGLACAHSGLPVAVLARGSLVIECEPEDAEVLLNDRFIGTVAGFAGKPIKLPAGVVRLELRREGYFSAYHELRIVDGVRQGLSVALRRRPF